WSTYCGCVWLPGAAVVALVPSIRFEVPLPVPAWMIARADCASVAPRSWRPSAVASEISERVWLCPEGGNVAGRPGRLLHVTSPPPVPPPPVAISTLPDESGKEPLTERTAFSTDAAAAAALDSAAAAALSAASTEPRMASRDSIGMA